jgi:hypothetical protein
MRIVRFQTDMRWWIWFSLILFIVSLWIPWVPILHPGDSLLSPRRLLSILLSLHREKPGPDIPIDFVGYYLRFALVICACAIVAIIIGWVLQSAVVIVRTTFFAKTAKPDHAS